MLNLRRNLESKENREEKQNRLGAEMNIRSGQGCFGGKAKVSTGSVLVAYTHPESRRLKCTAVEFNAQQCTE